MLFKKLFPVLIGFSMIFFSCDKKFIKRNAESITVDVPAGLSAKTGEYFDYLFARLSQLIEEDSDGKEYFEVLVNQNSSTDQRVYVGYNTSLKRVYIDPTASCYGLLIYSNVEKEKLNEKGAFKLPDGEADYTSDIFGEPDSTLLAGGKKKYKDIGLYHSRCKPYGN